MTTATATKSSTKGTTKKHKVSTNGKAQRAKKAGERIKEVKELTNQYWGEIVSWHPGRDSKTFTKVKKALEESGLDVDVARELVPTSAFSRACNVLADERIISVIRSDVDEVLFQFSKERVVDDE